MKKILIPICLLAMPIMAFSQGENDDIFEDILNEKEYEITTFETTRLINGHTTEIVGQRSLDFRINHRFWDINGGINEWFGLDGPGAIEMAFDYAYGDKFQFGIGRTNVNKFVNMYGKYRIMRQTTDNSNPLSITGVAKVSGTVREDNDGRFEKFSNRLVYTTQLHFARKFNKKLSLQIGPVYSHYNLVDSQQYNNDNFGLLFLGRYKMFKRAAITWEYNFRLNTIDNRSNDNSIYHNSIGLGFDIETGGHVFQVFINNSFSTEEPEAYFKTQSDITKGELRFGFNISRVFHL